MTKKSPTHLAFYDGKKLQPVCGASDDGCWVMAKKDATCEECLKDRN